MVTLDKWHIITQLVIDHVEGGYYHPDMLKNFKPSDQAILRASGETLFGLDRKAGSQLKMFPEWATFWATIDADRKVNPNWKYKYRGGKLEYRLKELASTIMFKWFNYLAKKYILVGSMDEIADDPRLLAHFSYASWNGEGWFERYAKALNNAIAKYPGNKEMIFQEAFKARSQAVSYVKVSGKDIKVPVPNRAIRQQAVNMKPIFNKLAAA